ncbi:MAG: sigma-54-dependent Fis family transcriptional regulator [Candidatus Schekmanbacteria bacterium]|nr:sigma-54-dependent Fis family transcriptional regulator [Candidatus Schekmanbacteria bacterium]
MKKILIVDDELSVRESLRIIFKNDYKIILANNGEEAVKIVEGESPDVMLLDIIMPGIDGIEVLKRIKTINPSINVIMLTATKTLKTAVSAMKIGAHDYITKPFDIDEIKAIVSKACIIKRHSLYSESSEDSIDPFKNIIGDSLKMKQISETVGKIASTESTVLITGESGTGKELIAKVIHRLSSREKGPFVAINCAAIPEMLIESELFGAEKGAYTSSVSMRIGKFEQANGGTLFLDEIADIPLSMQAKILRAIQEREFNRIGGVRTISVDIRLIAATNKDLEEEVAKKNFRSDLFYRINVVPINMPSLAERKEDIPLIIDYFIKKKSAELGIECKTISDEAVQVLKEYTWPGNVRELENTIERLMVLVQNKEILRSDLPEHLSKQNLLMELKRNVITKNMLFYDAEKELEKELIVDALKKANNIQTRAADILGISRRMLKYKMEKHGIEV